jgi:hypothetical protein
VSSRLGHSKTGNSNGPDIGYRCYRRFLCRLSPAPVRFTLPWPRPDWSNPGCSGSTSAPNPVVAHPLVSPHPPIIVLLLPQRFELQRELSCDDRASSCPMLGCNSSWSSTRMRRGDAGENECSCVCFISGSSGSRNREWVTKV